MNDKNEIGNTTLSLEERRAALRPGDVIRNPDLLCIGMRVLFLDKKVTIIGGRTKNDLDNYDYFPAWFESDDINRKGVGCFWIQNSDRVRFREWVPGFGPALNGSESHTWMSISPESERLLAQGLADAMAGRVSPFPSELIDAINVLPFRPHPECAISVSHDLKTLCLGCEEAIAKEMIRTDVNVAHERAIEEQRPRGREPYTPSSSGLGGAVGPILSHRRYP